MAGYVSAPNSAVQSAFLNSSANFGTLRAPLRSPTSQRELLNAVGLMSGTSADGVDVAALHTDGESAIKYLGSSTAPYPADVRNALLRVAEHDVPLVKVLRIEQQITKIHAQTVQRLLNDVSLAPPDVHVIGFHGHTIRHLPDEELTWQIGNALLLSEQTGIRVVGDFRRRDMAAGGTGAPLAPLYHAALLPDDIETPVAVLNIGGVANMTWIGADGTVLAGDTGPGCGLLDQWCQSHTGKPFDRDGELALQGRVNQESVQRSLDQPFFEQPFPKSADRFDFGHIDMSHLSPADGAATLCAITAAAIAAAMQQMPTMPKRTFISGGGGQHPVLMQQLRERLAGIASVSDIGWRPDSLEAECFAWLAVRSLQGLPLSLPSTTGARRPTGGGMVTL